MCAHAPRNVYGDPPFEAPGDFSRPNERYFAHAADIVARARDKGLLVLAAPAYMGYEGQGEGWYREMTAAGASRMRDFGRYVAKRFSTYRNVLWVQGGDFDPPEKTLLRAVADGIRDVDPSSLQTFHGARQTSALGFLGTGEPWLTVNDIYTSDTTVVEHALREYARSTMPFFLIEAIYENEHGADESVVRAQVYQSLLSGAAGYVTGNRPVWGFFGGWRTALDSGGARTLTHLHSLLDSLPWWTLVPDAEHRLLAQGTGPGPRAVAAIGRGGTLALIYTPGLGLLTCNLEVLRGRRISARWFDPTSGTYLKADHSSFEPKALRIFTPPGRNRRGFDDWVLVLESAVPSIAFRHPEQYELAQVVLERVVPSRRLQDVAIGRIEHGPAREVLEHLVVFVREPRSRKPEAEPGRTVHVVQGIDRIDADAADGVRQCLGVRPTGHCRIGRVADEGQPFGTFERLERCGRHGQRVATRQVVAHDRLFREDSHAA